VKLWDAPVRDVRPLLVAERVELIAFLRGLSDKQWVTPTAAPGWRVKDVALHLLDDDLGWLSRLRDGDSSGLLSGFGDHAGFMDALSAKNQRWVDGASGLSRRVVVDLLRWSGAQMDEYYASTDLLRGSDVGWASAEPAPAWLDFARDLTERWVHQRQMRDAVGLPGTYADSYIGAVLSTFVWAYPHQYRAQAARGAEVELDLDAGGRWHLRSDGNGRWDLEAGPAREPSAAVTMTSEAAWRCLTAAAFDQDQVRASGPRELTEPLLQVRGILV
jgi:uncharacterized protein (TIGR03083 family)